MMMGNQIEKPEDNGFTDLVVRDNLAERGVTSRISTERADERLMLHERPKRDNERSFI